MSREKGTRIPSRFRRPLSRRRYREIHRMLSNRTELDLLESVFSLGGDGKYHYKRAWIEKPSNLPRHF